MRDVLQVFRENRKQGPSFLRCVVVMDSSGRAYIHTSVATKFPGWDRTKKGDALGYARTPAALGRSGEKAQHALRPKMQGNSSKTKTQVCAGPRAILPGQACPASRHCNLQVFNIVPLGPASRDRKHVVGRFPLVRRY